MILSEHIMVCTRRDSNPRNHRFFILSENALTTCILVLHAPKGNRTPSSTLEGLRVTTTLLARIVPTPGIEPGSRPWKGHILTDRLCGRSGHTEIRTQVCRFKVCGAYLLHYVTHHVCNPYGLSVKKYVIVSDFYLVWFLFLFLFLFLFFYEVCFLIFMIIFMNSFVRWVSSRRQRRSWQTSCWDPPQPGDGAHTRDHPWPAYARAPWATPRGASHTLSPHLQCP